MTEASGGDRTRDQQPTTGVGDPAADDGLDVLRQVLAEVDAPPAHVVDLAKDAFVWWGMDAELAELVYDSATTTAGTDVRSAAPERQMTFRAPGLEIEVEVVSERTRTVIGQLVPAQPARVELRHAGRREEADADQLGRFLFEGVAAGPIKLTVVTAGGATVQTEGLVI